MFNPKAVQNRGWEKLVCLFLAALTIPLSFSCRPDLPAKADPFASWQILKEGQPVFGIVNLILKTPNGKLNEVNFYLDSIDHDHLLGTSRVNNFVCSLDWFTQETVNGNHSVYAVAELFPGFTVNISINVNVVNKSRLDSIPPGILKMTQQNDIAPPLLNSAFRDIWDDPTPVPGLINTAGAEDSPFITPDGNSLYFWFNGDE